MRGVREIGRVGLKDTSFVRLMQRRVYNVLLVAMPYDAFMLEDEGRVEERLFNEYASLSLRYPPRFTQVANGMAALEALEARTYELVLGMPDGAGGDGYGWAQDIRKRYGELPMVGLTPSAKVEEASAEGVDYVFNWQGNAELLLSIIKLTEDRLNAWDDARSAGVQVILLVDDEPRAYSSTLPHIYRFVLEQSQMFAREALNEHEQMLRLRGRPKILLLRTYEEATAFYEQFKEHTLGIICDMRFTRKGKKDALAGYAFGQHVRRCDRHVPLVLESTEAGAAAYVKELDASFIHKDAKNYPQELKRTIQERFGFGDFIIVEPETGAELLRIKDLKDLQEKVFEIPDGALRYHLSHNHFSRFLYSRALFPPAEILKEVDVNDYESMDEARRFVYELIVQYRRMRNAGVVASYRKERYDRYNAFARIGEGSLGGKGRGLAFIGAMSKGEPHWGSERMSVNIPTTVVLCTDLFDAFMEANNLYDVALSDTLSNEAILGHFLSARLSPSLIDDLEAFVKVVKGPVAVRSSSLLEDAHYSPFAGVYATYMVPPQTPAHDMVVSVGNAVKAVYASVFYKESKAYMHATANRIDQEKMAIILQQVVGTPHGNRYYPELSGVACSLNFYPQGKEKADEGVAHIALGLGKYIVEGGASLRFSPPHPRQNLQLSDLNTTQTTFYALDLTNTTPPTTDEGYNLCKLTLSEADADGALPFLVSTYDANNHALRDGYYPEGRKILSFVNILAHDAFPLAPTLVRLLHFGQKIMARPVEIEFAATITSQPSPHADFFLLQIRPMADYKVMLDEDLENIPRDNALIASNNVLGHGTIDNIRDIIYVKTDNYNSLNNAAIAREIDQMNRRFTPKGKGKGNGNGYILIGPGRWGSSDPALGIPVTWTQINYVRVIVERQLPNYRIDASQGTHFFHNLTALGIGYFTLSMDNQSWLDEAFLNNTTACRETTHLRHLHFPAPIIVKMDGRKGLGIIRKPSASRSRVGGTGGME